MLRDKLNYDRKDLKLFARCYSCSETGHTTF
jgi:hypothetical protein